MNFTPEQLAMAQEQMKNMSPEEMQERVKSMGSNYAGMNAMGIDPATMQSYMKMMQDNPDMMKMAAEQMKNMSPEQLSQAAKMSQGLGNQPAAQPKATSSAPLTGRGKKVQALKEEGIAFHKKKEYMKALDKYEDAIIVLDEIEDSKKPITEALVKLREACHLNSAACHLEMKNYRKAVRECTAVIHTKPNVKAYFRRATAKKFLGGEDDIRGAIADLERALKIDSKQKKCKELLEDLRTKLEQTAPENESKGDQKDEAKGFETKKVESKTGEAKAGESKAAQKRSYFSGDVKTLSIREMKKILSDNGVDYKSVTEKSEMIALVEKHCMKLDKNEDDEVLVLDEEEKSDSKERKREAKRVTVEDATSSKGSGVSVEDVSENEPYLSQKTTTSASSTTPASSSSIPNVDMNAAREQMAKMTPEQMRMQAQMMRSMPPDQLRRLNPMMAHLTDEQIRMGAEQMERMAANPEQARMQMKMASEMMKNMTPEQIQNMAKMRQAMNGTSSSSAPTQASSAKASPSTDTTPSSSSAGQPMPNGFPSGDMASQQAQAMKMMENMDAKQLKAMMQMQRDMLKNNPQLFEQMKKSNPAMAGLTAEDFQQKMDMMADMDENQLKSMMGMAQKVGKVVQPMMDVWARLDKLLCGQAKNIAVGGIAIFAWYWVDYFFFSP